MAKDTWKREIIPEKFTDPIDEYSIFARQLESVYEIIGDLVNGNIGVTEINIIHHPEDKFYPMFRIMAKDRGMKIKKKKMLEVIS